MDSSATWAMYLQTILLTQSNMQKAELEDVDGLSACSIGLVVWRTLYAWRITRLLTTRIGGGWVMT